MASGTLCRNEVYPTIYYPISPARSLPLPLLLFKFLNRFHTLVSGFRLRFCNRKKGLQGSDYRIYGSEISYYIRSIYRHHELSYMRRKESSSTLRCQKSQYCIPSTYPLRGKKKTPKTTKSIPSSQMHPPMFEMRAIDMPKADTMCDGCSVSRWL